MSKSVLKTTLGIPTSNFFSRKLSPWYYFNTKSKFNTLYKNIISYVPDNLKNFHLCLLNFESYT